MQPKRGEQKSSRPENTKFKQQELRSWQPMMTPNSVICIFTVVAVIFIPVGIGILVASKSIITVGPIRYDQIEPSLDNFTFAKFHWPETTTSEVYFYYQLGNFYQNHRTYVQSRSDVQLSSSKPKDKLDVSNCEPWQTWKDFQPPNIPLPSGDLSKIKLNPCGLVANTQFNDTFDIFDGDCTTDPVDCSPATLLSGQWTSKGIAWESDLDTKFKNIANFTTPSVLQHKDVEDEEFVVWMRTAAFPNFKKLNRILKKGLKKGTYTIRVEQNFPVAAYKGHKSFYLSTSTWVGGRNDFMGWAYIIVGIVCAALALMFLVKKMIDPRVADARARAIAERQKR